MLNKKIITGKRVYPKGISFSGILLADRMRI